MPKTLVAIPTFNAEKFIARTIESCIDQTKTAEVWVVDNCSTDNTARIVNEYCESHDNVKLFSNQSNLGRVGNWNRCLDLFEPSSFQFLKLVFSGDTLLPQCIEKVESIFAQQPDLSMVAWPYVFVDAAKKSTRTVRLLDEDIRLSLEELIDRNMYPSQFAGAIICHTFAKEAVRQERFNDVFLGMAEFTNKVPQKGDYYHLNTPLSEFHLDGHSSYAKQFEYLFVLERAYTKAITLKQIEDVVTQEKYESLKQSILAQIEKDFK